MRSVESGTSLRNADRNLTFLFRSREATTHRVYLNEVDTPLRTILGATLAPLLLDAFVFQKMLIENDRGSRFSKHLMSGEPNSVPKGLRVSSVSS